MTKKITRFSCMFGDGNVCLVGRCRRDGDAAKLVERVSVFYILSGSVLDAVDSCGLKLGQMCKICDENVEFDISLSCLLSRS
jgi:hypothetical protein